MYPEAASNRAHCTQTKARADRIQGRWTNRGRTGRNGPNSPVKQGIQGIQRGGRASDAKREDEGGVLITESMKKAIEKVLSKGDRVELIPIKDGVKIMHIKREEIRAKENRPG